MSGHLFVVRGDLTNLACDAILVPSGWGDQGIGHVARASWHEVLEDRVDADGYCDPRPPEDERVVKVIDRPGERAVWVGHTGAFGQTVEWYAAAVGKFVAAAAERRLADRPLGVDRPLIATPIVGIGMGGIVDRKGEMVRALVEAVRREQAHVDVDVAVVCWGDFQYAALQQARRSVCGDQLWEELPTEQLDAATRLAERARAKQLVLFVGAGASRGAGAPDWQGLLVALAKRVHMSPDEQCELVGLDARDAGAVLEQRYGDKDALRQAVVELTTIGRWSLVHQLLAGLPVDEAVTTNYDQGLEGAMADAGRRPSVLRGEAIDDHRRWVLKLHGSVDRPEDIVLSRDDYLRFEGRSAALGGVVQALLLTRHMAFVGYSLQDDNFHRLVHQVRDTLITGDGVGHVPFATALTPGQSGLMQDVWSKDVDYIRVDGPRLLAVLLDWLGSETAPIGSQLLDPTYSAMFNPEEQKLRDALFAARALAEAPGVSDAVKRAFPL